MRMLLGLATAALATTANAQQDFEYWPNANYDPAIPTVESVLGHAPGERITWHAEALRYFTALESSQPDRVAVHRYASSWEGRDLVYVVITSPENMRRIDAIKGDMQSLRNVLDTSRSEADRIIQTAPAVNWLAYGIHGDEISSTDAAMLTAYHLLASRGDDRVDDILRESVVIIDPMQNPDGRNRFVQHYRSNRGIVPQGSSIAAERTEAWPGGPGGDVLAAAARTAQPRADLRHRLGGAHLRQQPVDPENRVVAAAVTPAKDIDAGLGQVAQGDSLQPAILFAQQAVFEFGHGGGPFLLGVTQ